MVPHRLELELPLMVSCPIHPEIVLTDIVVWAQQVDIFLKPIFKIYMAI